MAEDGKTAIKRQLEALKTMDIKELRREYQDLLGIPARSISRDYLIRRIAYRLQEIHYGGIVRKELEMLDNIADGDPLANLKAETPYAGRGRRLIIGTIFVREWHGKIYKAVFRGHGKYEYNGKTFGSLTAIASLITGMKWSGTTFFGVSGSE